MDKGKAIKLGIAAVILIVAAFFIFRAVSGGGDSIDAEAANQRLTPN